MKRILALIFSALLLTTTAPIVLATSPDQQSAAEKLYDLGLFKGTGIDENGHPIFSLDRPPTRLEGVVMLVRLLGEEYTATYYLWEDPFVDVPRWGNGYVGLAYSKGLTNGIDNTHFGSDNYLTATQYLTFVLRALGYKSGIDFSWDSAWVLTDKLGITDGQYNSHTTEFTRGDAALVSYRALSVCPKGSSKTLLETIQQNIDTLVPDYEIAPASNIELIQYYMKTIQKYRNGALEDLHLGLSKRANSVSQHVYAIGFDGNYKIIVSTLSNAIDACSNYPNLMDLKTQLQKEYSLASSMVGCPDNINYVYSYLSKVSSLSDKEEVQYQVIQNIYSSILKSYTP